MKKVSKTKKFGNKKMLILSMIMLMLIMMGGVTYAYFTAIQSGDSGSSVVIQTGTLELLYEDTEYINISGMMPSDSVSKTVVVTNEGNLPVTYDLIWYNLTNGFTTTSDLVMTISCVSSTDTCAGLSQTEVSATGTDIPIISDVTIDALEVHTYVITLTFLETGINQNDNQGADLAGKIGIVESDT